MAKNNKYSFLRGKIALAVIGLLLGLFSGFKVANSQYRRAQSVRQLAALRTQPPGARGAQGAQGGAGSPDSGHATAEVSAVIEKAKANPK